MVLETLAKVWVPVQVSCALVLIATWSDEVVIPVPGFIQRLMLPVVVSWPMPSPAVTEETPLTIPREEVDTHCVPTPVVCRIIPLVPEALALSYKAPVTRASPTTTNFCAGVVVPIPTLPDVSIVNALVAAALTLIPKPVYVFMVPGAPSLI